MWKWVSPNFRSRYESRHRLLEASLNGTADVFRAANSHSPIWEDPSPANYTGKFNGETLVTVHTRRTEILQSSRFHLHLKIGQMGGGDIADPEGLEYRMSQVTNR